MLILEMNLKEEKMMMLIDSKFVIDLDKHPVARKK